MPEVKCTVTSCKYWEEGHHCSAEEILVATHNYFRVDEPSKPEHTLCRTFEPKESGEHE